MNEAIPAAEQHEQEIALVKCWNDDDRYAVTEGPDGEPLCEPCAVTLARDYKRAAKLSRRRNRLAGCAPTIKTRSAA